MILVLVNYDILTKPGQASFRTVITLLSFPKT